MIKCEMRLKTILILKINGVLTRSDINIIDFWSHSEGQIKNQETKDSGRRFE